MNVHPGDRLFGFCHGMFSPMGGADKLVIAVGENWIVALENGAPVTAQFGNLDQDQINEHLRCWKLHDSLVCDDSCKAEIEYQEDPHRVCPECGASVLKVLLDNPPWSQVTCGNHDWTCLYVSVPEEHFPRA